MILHVELEESLADRVGLLCALRHQTRRQLVEQALRAFLSQSPVPPPDAVKSRPGRKGARMTSNRITSSTFEGWMPVAEEAQTKGMEIEACWEGDPARITRVSVRGDRTGDASDDAVRRVLRAYGVADGVALSWEAGEGEDEQVAFVSELLECEHE